LRYTYGWSPITSIRATVPVWPATTFSVSAAPAAAPVQSSLIFELAMSGSAT
jgi:hypothetical protein